jgi:GNAT superfamily N-acetyltransferase
VTAHDVDCAETLKNGVRVRIRTLRADDRDRMARAFRLLDRASVYRRLFTFKNGLTEADLDRIMTVDPEREAAIVATVGAGATEAIIGSGRYFAASTNAAGRVAEVAFIVEEDYHGLGIAGRLLTHLAAIARASGIAAFQADVLADNQPMLAVFQRSGLPIDRQHVQGVVHVMLSLGSSRSESESPLCESARSVADPQPDRREPDG